MKNIQLLILVLSLVIVPFLLSSQDIIIKPGAYNTIEYLYKLKGEKVGVVANQSSMIYETHLVDSLISNGVDVVRMYSPEHGFRGQAENGEHISNDIDSKTGIEIISIYGQNKKPSKESLDGIEIMIFDLQDVGARFYTYISTLHYIMEACAELDIPVLVLDRPNPNGFYIDGPLLEKEVTSFVGMHPVPIVYGMTIGEYGLMINGEMWLKDSVICDMEVIKCSNYDHNSLYQLPIKPSPNLPDVASVYLYPSLCLFEGTIVSVGRGTEHPFKCYGHPDFHIGTFSFVPKSIPGASLNPKLKGENCVGQNLEEYPGVILREKKLNLYWLIKSYEVLSGENDFFISFFDKLAGNRTLREQIISGVSEAEIRDSWEEGLNEFKETRAKYLLYPDFD